MFSLLCNAALSLLSMIMLSPGPLTKFVRVDSSLFYGYDMIMTISEANERLRYGQSIVNMGVWITFVLSLAVTMGDYKFRKGSQEGRYNTSDLNWLYSCLFCISTVGFAVIAATSTYGMMVYNAYAMVLRGYLENEYCVRIEGVPVAWMMLASGLSFASSSALYFVSKRGKPGSDPHSV